VTQRSTATLTLFAGWMKCIVNRTACRHIITPPQKIDCSSDSFPPAPGLLPLFRLLQAQCSCRWQMQERGEGQQPQLRTLNDTRWQRGTLLALDAAIVEGVAGWTWQQHTTHTDVSTLTKHTTHTLSTYASATASCSTSTSIVAANPTRKWAAEAQLGARTRNLVDACTHVEMTLCNF